jgi:DNA-binding NarL/FixJ family response regulator
MPTKPRPATEPDTPILTTAQRLVIAGFARGWSKKRVGQDLYFSPAMIRRRMQIAAVNLGCRSRQAALVAAAYRARALADFAPEPRPYVDLTTQQLQLLHEIADGLTNDEIADQNQVPVDTVDGRVCSLYRRLGAVSRPHAVALGFQMGHLTIPQPA